MWELLDFETRTENRLNDHAARIKILEIKDATQDGKIEMLCEKISEWMDFMKQALMKILGVFITASFVFFSFFIWYVQHLGGG